MRRMALAAAAMVLLASACSGPGQPLEVGIKEFPTDVLLGDPNATPIPIGLDTSVPVVVRPGPFATPPPIFATPTPACPDAHPLAVPRLVATSRAELPPVAGQHFFRTEGNVEVGELAFQLPPVAVREISNIEMADDGSFTYDLESGSTTTTWRVVPEGSGGGIFMVRQVSPSPDGGEVVFEPIPAIQFLQFPAEPGASWDSIGVDTSSSTVMELNGRIGIDVPDPDDPDVTILQSKARVDACGEVLDAWYVEIRGLGGEGPARITSPTTNIELRGTYAFATQYGGFSVADVVRTDGTIGATEFHSVAESTISAEPEEPQP